MTVSLGWNKGCMSNTKCHHIFLLSRRKQINLAVGNVQMVEMVNLYKPACTHVWKLWTGSELANSAQTWVLITIDEHSVAVHSRTSTRRVDTAHESICISSTWKNHHLKQMQSSTHTDFKIGAVSKKLSLFFFTHRAVIKARKAFFSERWEATKAEENPKVCTSWGPSGVRNHVQV